MLFASEIVEGSSWVAIIMAGLAGLFAYLSARETRLSKQTELANDSEKLQLKMELKDAREDRDDLRKQVDSLQAELREHKRTCPN